MHTGGEGEARGGEEMGDEGMAVGNDVENGMSTSRRVLKV